MARLDVGSNVGTTVGGGTPAAQQSGYYTSSGAPIPASALQSYFGQIVRDSSNIPGRLNVDGQGYPAFNPLSPSEAYYYGFGPDPTPPTGGGSSVHDAPTATTGDPYTIDLGGGRHAVVQPTNYGLNTITTYADPAADKPPTYLDPNRTPKGYQNEYDDQGHVIAYVPAAPSGSSTGLVDLGNGYYGAADPNGGYSDYIKKDNNAVSYVKISGGYLQGVDKNGQYVGQPIRDNTPEAVTGTVDYGNGIIGLDTKNGVTSTTTAPDYMSPAHLKYLNDSLAQDTAYKKSQLAEQQAEAAQASGDRRAALESQMQQTKMSIASNEKIASIANATDRAKAILSAGVTERGQNIDYAATTRGQDVQNLGNTTQAVGQYYDTASRMANDVVRQTDLLTGGSGLGTPDAVAANDYRGYISGLIKNTPMVKAAAPISSFATPAVKLGAHSGGRVTDDEFVLGSGKHVPLDPGTTLHVKINEKGPEGLVVKVNHLGDPVLDRIVPHDQMSKIDFGAATGATLTPAQQSKNAVALRNAARAGSQGSNATGDRGGTGGVDYGSTALPGGGGVARGGDQGSNAPPVIAPPVVAPAASGSPGGGGVVIGGTQGSNAPPVVAPTPAPVTGPALGGYGTNGTGVQANAPGTHVDKTTYTATRAPLATPDPALDAAYKTVDALPASTLLGTYNVIRRGDNYFFHLANGGVGNPVTPDQLKSMADRANKKNGTTTSAAPAAPAAPATPAAAPPPAAPDATDTTIFGGTGTTLPTDQAGLDAAKAKFATLLGNIAAGHANPVTDLNLPPVYGVKLGNPQDYAATYDSWDEPTKKILVSAFAAALGMDPDSARTWFETRLRRYQPSTLNAGQVVQYA